MGASCEARPIHLIFAAEGALFAEERLGELFPFVRLLFVFCSPTPPPLPLPGVSWGELVLYQQDGGGMCRQSRHCKELTAKVVKRFELRLKKRPFWNASAKVVISVTLYLSYLLSILYAAWTARRGQLRAGLHDSIHMLILPGGGKLVCQLFFRGKWLMGWEL